MCYILFFNNMIFFLPFGFEVSGLDSSSVSITLSLLNYSLKFIHVNEENYTGIIIRSYVTGTRYYNAPR